MKQKREWWVVWCRQPPDGRTYKPKFFLYERDAWEFWHRYENTGFNPVPPKIRR